MELNFVLNSGEHIKKMLEKKSLNLSGRSENILFNTIPEQHMEITLTNITAMKHQETRYYQYYISI